MYFIVLFGPPAVGKMSVGNAIENRIGIKLFHNHDTIELILKYFEFGTPSFNNLVDDFRMKIFHEVSDSDLSGLIFTYVWDLDSEKDNDFVEKACDIFNSKGAEIILVELKTDLPVRLIRNKTQRRLDAKPSKRNIEKSKLNLLYMHENYRLNTDGNKLPLPYKHICINNTEMTEKETADLVINSLNTSQTNA